MLTILFVVSQRSIAQKPVNWTKDQLIEPSELSQLLKSHKTIPVLFSVGPGATIPGSIDIGMVKDGNKLDLLKKQLDKLPNHTKIVVYCGCCPFEKCPNIRPAFSMLKGMGFSNGKLLNIPVNLKQNWISKGYPMASEDRK